MYQPVILLEMFNSLLFESSQKVKPRLAEVEKPEDILVGDSESNIDKKR